MGPDVVVDLLSTEARPRDTYLLCSDGLNGMLSDEEILGVVKGHLGELEAGCDELVQKANAAGGNDNTTVVMVYVDPDESDADPVEGPVAGGALELIEQQGGLEALVAQLEAVQGDDADEI
jgi:protein phosphatase